MGHTAAPMPCSLYTGNTHPHDLAFKPYPLSSTMGHTAADIFQRSECPIDKGLEAYIIVFIVLKSLLNLAVGQHKNHL
ncbi:hypothetical protein HNQ69_001502 [Bartonella callosciuri]|uniref:Uncharacterized protein n=1 Tax=Bartonella callosciuri TaxID=686223 RepID=A0A840NS73_9HYPH|nr:hypothetical protein [Bartonella callosciuri]